MRLIGLLQESLRRYCLILREHESISSHAETSGRRDMDLLAGETTGAKRLFEQKPEARFGICIIPQQHMAFRIRIFVQTMIYEGSAFPSCPQLSLKAKGRTRRSRHEFMALGNRRRDQSQCVSARGSSYGHIWTGNGVDLASWIRSNTSSQLAAHSLLAPHSVEDLTPFTSEDHKSAKSSSRSRVLARLLLQPGILHVSCSSNL